MTHSTRKPYDTIVGVTPLGMRQYKRIRVGKERARVRAALAHENYNLAEVELAPWNDWDCPNDGAKVYSPDDERLIRK